MSGKEGKRMIEARMGKGGKVEDKISSLRDAVGENVRDMLGISWGNMVTAPS